jgi:tetratricopeptide (TPR) repeat protein
MRLRTYNLLRAGVLSLQQQDDKQRQILGPEVDARLDWKDGLAEYHHDPKWHADVIAHFEFNLRRIVAIAAEAGVPLLIVNPVANLQWEPFKSEHRADLTAAELAKFDKLMAEARDLYGSDLLGGLEKLQAAARIDPLFAGVHYEIGSTLLELGRRNEAEQALLQAKELDVCPLRILQPMQQIVRNVARETNTPLVDADAVLAALSRNGFADRQWLVDHVHPTIEGHQQLADAIAAKLAELNYVQPTGDWSAKKDTAYREHLASLSHVYFDRARSRLKSEQGWARGQVNRERPQDARSVSEGVPSDD